MPETMQSPVEPSSEGIAAGDPPLVPAARMGSRRLRDVHLLLWVHTGTARVETSDGQVHRLTAGHGVWLPVGTATRVSTPAGSVAFPYEFAARTVPSAPAGLVRFSVPDGWRDWLVMHYVHQISPVTSFGYSRDTLFDVLSAAGAPPQVSPAARTSQDRPPLPTAPGARTVAEELRMNPALDRGIEQWAALATCSVSTLRRGFLETGLTFAEWRAASRLAAAREFLAAGYGIERVAALVGFSSRNGFTRAFRQHHGITPRDYAALATRSSQDPSERVAAERRSGALALLLGQPAGLPARPPHGQPLPASQTPPHTNDVHVLIWTYRGEGYLKIGDTAHPRRRGDAIWIPAGVEHQAGDLRDSISMPIGDLLPRDAHVGAPLRTHFPASWDAYLMHRSISLRTHLRPEDFDYRHILDVFREQLALQRSRTVPMPREARARAIATQFLQEMRTPPDVDVAPAIHEAFRNETRMTFAHWQNVARMRTAGDLLDNGATPSAVARRVGYAHLRNFTRAFRSFHGVPPSTYRRSARASS